MSVPVLVLLPVVEPGEGVGVQGGVIMNYVGSCSTLELCNTCVWAHLPLKQSGRSFMQKIVLLTPWFVRSSTCNVGATLACVLAVDSRRIRDTIYICTLTLRTMTIC